MRLTPDDQELAREAARRRWEFARGRRLTPDAPDHTFAQELDTAGAEIALARTINEPWNGWQFSYDGDVGDRCEARHTRHGRLLLLHGEESAPRRKVDPDDHDYFLVTGPFPDFEVVGWQTGRLGKLKGVVRELQPGRPCICVSPDDLLPVERWTPRDIFACTPDMVDESAGMREAAT